MKQTKGIVGMSSLVGLIILAVTLPFLNNLITKPQDTRNLAVDLKQCTDKDGNPVDSGNKYCTGGNGYAMCKNGEPDNKQTCTEPMQCFKNGTGIHCDCVDMNGKPAAWLTYYCKSYGTYVARAQCGKESEAKKCSSTCVDGSCDTAEPPTEDCTGVDDKKGVVVGDKYCTGAKSWKKCGYDLKGSCLDTLECKKGQCVPSTGTTPTPDPDPKCYDKDGKLVYDKDGAVVYKGQNYCPKANKDATLPITDQTWKTCGKDGLFTCEGTKVCKYGYTGAGAECIDLSACGGETQNCCVTDDITKKCNSKILICNKDKCEKCGGSGQVCCSRYKLGSTTEVEKYCGGGSACGADGKCGACGLENQPCCGGDSCIGDGLVCDTDITGAKKCMKACFDKDKKSVKVTEWGCSTLTKLAQCVEKSDKTVEWSKGRDCPEDCKDGKCGCKAEDSSVITKLGDQGCQTTKIVSKCDYAGWKKVDDCSDTCKDGKCGCISGDSKKTFTGTGVAGCKNSKEVAVCGKEGWGETTKTCATGNCVDGDCGCKDDDGSMVKSGGYGCKNEKTLVWCNEKGWDLSKTSDCATGTSCAEGVCGCLSEDKTVFTKPGTDGCKTNLLVYKCTKDKGWTDKVEECTAEKPCVGGVCTGKTGDPPKSPSTCTKNKGSYSGGVDIIGGDFDCDGVVNIADYSVWRKEAIDGIKWKGSSHWWTDIDGDGYVTNNDSGYSRWRYVFLE